MSIPDQAGKFGIDKLSHINQVMWDGSLSAFGDTPALLTEKFSSYRFDYLWHPNVEIQSRLFVLFSGDAQRTRNNPPVFQRWSWAQYFPGHCLYVSDPSLFLDENLGLAWYAGTSTFDPMPRIIDTVQRLASKLGVDARHIYTYGSSGGGFASLRMAALCPEVCAVAVNPQINITQYEFKNVDRYLRLCYEGRGRDESLREFASRLNMVEHAGVLRGRRIIYIQNVLDTHHHEVHFKPFCQAMGCEPVENRSEGMFRRLLFSHEGGHVKAETQDVFDAAMTIIETDAVFA